jgi:hypothetical protein
MHILEIVEILGTIAFAMSGAFVAIDKELDYYGIAIFAIVTATGGGIIRDVLVSKNVPTSLENPFFALISVASAVVVIFFYNRVTTTNTRKVIQYLDAAGLAAFTAIGARVALANGFDQPYIIITFAVLTVQAEELSVMFLPGKFPLFSERSICCSFNYRCNCLHDCLEMVWPAGSLVQLSGYHFVYSNI